MTNGNAAAGPAGVGGWLRVLIVCLMWLGPAMTAAEVFLAVYMQVRMPGVGLRPVFVIGDLFFLATGYFSFTAGRGLLAVKPDAVKTAILYFEVLIAGCLLVVVYTAKLLFFSEIQDGGGLQFIIMAVYPLIYSIAWHSYLSSSLRVRNTYR